MKKNAKSSKPEAEAATVPKDNPHGLARSWLASQAEQGHGCHIVFHRGEFFRWQGACYVKVPAEDLRAQLTAHAASEFQLEHENELQLWANRAQKGEKPPKRTRVTTTLVGDVIQAVGGECHIPSDVTPPSWINGSTGGDPRKLLATPSGVLDLAGC